MVQEPLAHSTTGKCLGISPTPSQKDETLVELSLVWQVKYK